MAKYSAEELRALVKKGQAMPPDGAYPCADAEDVNKAIQAVGRGGADHDTIRRHIIKNAKRLGVKTPPNWNPDGSLKAAAQMPDEHMPPAAPGKKRKPPMPAPTGYAPVPDAPAPEQADGRPPTRDERETAAASVRAMQDALAPWVDALYSTPSGMDVLEAFNHFGRAADALHYALPGATGIALAELTAAAELLRQAADRSVDAALVLNPIATMTEEAVGAVETWPTTHAAVDGAEAFADDARLVLTPIEGGFVLTDDGAEVARFAAEGDALEAVAGYALPEDSPDVGTPFNVFLAPEGVESGDGRMLELGTTTWRDPPLALMMQDTTAHGLGDPAPAWFAGAIERVWRDPADASRILGRGHLAPGADGQRAEEQIRAGMRGVSIDGINLAPPSHQVTQVNQEGMPVGALVRYGDTRIMGATVLPFGAFEPCTIWFDDEATPERVTATHGQQIAMDTPPEIVDTSDSLAVLVASGGGPANPPRAWFYVPAPDGYMAPTVTAAGQFMGHIGPAGSCHIGQVGRCTTIPASSTNYRYFHRTTAMTAEGEKVPCGWLTMDTSHERNLNASAQAAMNHYDHTGSQVAKIRVVDTPNGPWACGAVAPGLTEQQVWKLQDPEVSGDWRPIDGYMREMVAVLAVPLPGFLTQRPEALVASGQVVAQIGTLPCDDGCDGPTDFMQNLAAADGPVIVRVSAADMAMLKALRPHAMAAIHDKVSTPEMLEAARKAAEPDLAAEWRERLRV